MEPGDGVTLGRQAAWKNAIDTTIRTVGAR